MDESWWHVLHVSLTCSLSKGRNFLSEKSCFAITKAVFSCAVREEVLVLVRLPPSPVFFNLAIMLPWRIVLANRWSPDSWCLDSPLLFKQYIKTQLRSKKHFHKWFYKSHLLKTYHFNKMKDSWKMLFRVRFQKKA